jgi:hypothetical protein
VEQQLSGGEFLVTAELGDVLRTDRLVLEAAADGIHFSPTAYTAAGGAGNRYRFTLPAAAAGSYHRVQAIGDAGPVYSKVLPPLEDDRSPRPGQARVFPDPATNFVNVSIMPDEKFTSAEVINCMGQVLLSNLLPPGKTVVRCELPASLSAGLYFIRLTGMGKAPLTVRVLKTP